METVICFDGSRLFWQPSSLGTVICFYHLLSWKTHTMCESVSLLFLLYLSSSLPLHLLVFVFVQIRSEITCFRWKSCSVFSVCPATWPGWEAHCWLLTNVYKKFYCENSEKIGTNDQMEKNQLFWRFIISKHFDGYGENLFPGTVGADVNITGETGVPGKDISSLKIKQFRFNAKKPPSSPLVFGPIDFANYNGDIRLHPNSTLKLL